MARATLAVPIGETQLVLGGTSNYFTDDEVQDALDATGTPVEMLSLSALPDALVLIHGIYCALLRLNLG